MQALWRGDTVLLIIPSSENEVQADFVNYIIVNNGFLCILIRHRETGAFSVLFTFISYHSDIALRISISGQL